MNKLRNFMTFVIWLLMFTSLGYLYYNAQASNKKLQDISQQNLILINNDKNINNHVNAFEDKLNKLDNQINNLLAKNSLLLIELNELISMSNQAIIVYGDVRGTIKLLTYAINKLDLNTDPQYLELKNAITENINILGQMQYIDSMVLTSKINNIMAQIATLPLVNIHEANEYHPLVNNQSKVNNTMTSLWDKFWNNIKQDLKSIVIISSVNQSKEIQLLPEKEIIIKQNIKLYLLNARIAILQRDDNAWKFNLQNIKSDLNDYFNKNPITNSIIDSIDGLLKINITMDNVNIDKTLNALNKLNNIHH